MTDEPKTAYKRVMLKISGEALMGDGSFGLHPPTVERIAKEVAARDDSQRACVGCQWIQVPVTAAPMHCAQQRA